MRRVFAVLLPAAAGALFTLAVARAQVDLGAGEPPLRTYEGVSARGDFQEALNSAVAQALHALPGADRMVRYRVRDITGQQGGIAGVNLLRVTVEAEEGGAPVRPAPVRPAPRPAPAPDGAPPGQDDGIFTSLRGDLHVSAARAQRGDPVSFRFTVRNVSDRTIRLQVHVSDPVRFEVWRNNHLVWQSGRGMLRSHAIVLLPLVPDEQRTYTATWDQLNNDRIHVPAGRYEIRAYLTTELDGQRLEGRAPLTIFGS